MSEEPTTPVDEDEEGENEDEDEDEDGNLVVTCESCRQKIVHDGWTEYISGECPFWNELCERCAHKICGECEYFEALMRQGRFHQDTCTEVMNRSADFIQEIEEIKDQGYVHVWNETLIGPADDPRVQEPG